MNESVLDDLTPNEELKAPNGLKILAALTFIGSGILILILFYTLYTLNNIKYKEIETIAYLSVYGFILINIVCIMGTYFMLKLKKTGFYIHATCNLITSGFIIKNIITLINTPMYDPSSTSVRDTSLLVFFLFLAGNLLFIYLYSKHRKSMVR